MTQKKLMLLGGLRYLLPVIEEAHKLGAYVITADYLPDNIAHKYSDEYCNVSIIDKDAVLKEAQRLQIDGILSHAVDPGVVTAAYVAEKMGLPFQCSYKTACILQDKHLFRKFLSDNGFNCPNAKGYNNIEEALNDVNYFNWPVIVKPVDSAGSKGVTRVDDKSKLKEAIEFALSESHNGYFIIEDFLEKQGFSAGSESFVVDGKLLYNGFYDQYFDKNAINPYTPSAEVWPSIMEQKYQEEIKSELQRLFTLLEVTTGLFNVECRVCTNGKAYLMEVSPRAGGNRLAELLNYAADVNINAAETRKALGLSIENMHEPNYKGHFAILVLHSDKTGVFQSVEIASKFIKEHVIEEELRIKEGDIVYSFTGANAALGTLFLRFDSREELAFALENQSTWLKINVK
ncbi:ATP-grasp domain-containing protein [uncultured Prevotella sp.]|uniref:ATP-grasp domain-containing protein n=1 Tax=uncultured Prevotella sp. TaxID=159272 RepID=UPI0027E37A98|nr:ATP-grasp domain-containing protein [uncultured Prevotella sp.]